MRMHGHDLAPGKLICGAAACGAASGSKKWLFLEAGSARDQHIGKRLDADVEVAHGAVVVAPRHLQLILDLGELGLQLEEILVGLELRIGLGHRHQLAERALQGARRRGLVADAARGDARGALRAVTSSNTPRSWAA